MSFVPLRCRTNTAVAPTKTARLAMLRAKEEEAQRLNAVLEEIKNRECDAQALLEEKKKRARDVMTAAAPLQLKLARAQAVAVAWTRRSALEAGHGVGGNVPGKSDADKASPMVA
jgi:hypothetical protein